MLSDRDKKAFHDFKVVEIINQTQVKDLYTFTHPKYADQQTLILSKSSEFMLELLSYNRIFLYQRAGEVDESSTKS